LTLLVAGNDTVRNSVSWLIYLLGQNPSALQKVQQEVDTELKGELPTFNDIPKLRCCRNTYMEALRIRSPGVSQFDREASKDITVCGTFIPKGTILNMYFQAPMIDGTFWVNPLSFDPDRFENLEQYSANFTAFSVGRRSCVGQKFAMQEGILLLATLAQNFDIQLCKDFPVSADSEGTLLPKGLHCKFIPRQN